ncbi:hypothetical protein [Sphingomicrobium sediminis]|uniref:Uncharacterized protein n=1 Tax=Sphingomicrobium sediminis TaxID=2950949 RepID=A0A9X2EJB2_9SPHN|nr:hypothetical protein [Sphingomicrobium sediminis]MCM8557836.1 hypothetical protein [Sphingomicrobium sediminis]
MQTLLEQYWPVIVVAVVIGIITAFFLFRPKQSVRLSDDTPARPHMAGVEDGRSKEGKTVVDAGAAGLSDELGQFMQAEIHEELPGATGEPDNLRQLKGVGPKLAQTLNGMGLVRFEQIAKLSPSQVEAIDNQLGSFKGRLTRDKVVEQADYLARGDVDGYEAKFGKL